MEVEQMHSDEGTTGLSAEMDRYEKSQATEQTFTQVTIDDINFSSDEDENESNMKSPTTSKFSSNFPSKDFSKAIFSPTTEESDDEEEVIMDHFFSDTKKKPKLQKKKASPTPSPEKADIDNGSEVSTDAEVEDTSPRKDKEEDFADDEEDKEDEEEKRESVPLVNSVVQAEIEAVKKIEQGPTEAELRRRRLIELDEDELEEKIERFNKMGIKMMSKATGLSKIERRQKLIECREYLLKYWQDEENEEYVEWIQTFAEKHARRLYGNEVEVPFDPMDYLDQETYSDEEEEDEKSKREEKEDDVISLSDSDEEHDAAEEAEEVEVLKIKPTVIPIDDPVPTPVVASKRPLFFLASHMNLDQLNALNPSHGAMNVPRSSRAQLLFSLRKQVHVTAKENYCLQRKIKSDQLSLRIEISEKCRQLVELLKKRFEEKILTDRESRRKHFLSAAKDDEEEFDEDNFELPEGQFLTDEERRKLLQQFADENASEEEDEQEEEEQEDMDIAEVEEENEEEEVSPEAVQEELAANDEFADQDEVDKVRMQRLKKKSSKVDDDDEDEDEDPIVKKSKSSNTQKRFSSSQLSDDEEENVAMTPAAGTTVKRNMTKNSADTMSDDGKALDDHVVEGPKASSSTASSANHNRLKQYGKTTMLSFLKKTINEVAETNEEEQEKEVVNENEAEGDAVVEEVVEEEEEEEEEVIGEEKKVKKRVKTGNALFRLQLEEEDRRHRKENKSSFFDDEAEEEEEEGHQAGLGDFGFGVTSKNKEMEDEKNALKLRKDDLDHIVDDLSEDEEDDIEGAAKQRALLELQDDQTRTRRIIDAVTNGFDPIALRNQKKVGYSFEQLVQQQGSSSTKKLMEGMDGTNTADNEDGEGRNGVEEELDEEELLQRGLSARVERMKKTQQRKMLSSSYGGDGGSEDEDEEEEGGGEDEADYLAQQEEELMKELLETNASSEEKAVQWSRLVAQKESYQLEILKRKQMEKEFKIRRELKAQARRKLQSQQFFHPSSQQPHTQQPQTQSQGGVGGVGGVGGGTAVLAMHRQWSDTSHTSSTSTITGANTLLRRHSSVGNTTTTGGGGGALRGGVGGAAGGASYRGILSGWEVEGGMATATHHSHSTTTPAARGLKRSFTNILSSTSTSTSSSSALVGKETQQKAGTGHAMKRSTTTTAVGGGGGGGSGFVFKQKYTAATTAAAELPTSDTGNGGNGRISRCLSHHPMTTPSATATATTASAANQSSSSLFSKLSSRSAGMLKRSHSVMNQPQD